MDIPLDGSPDTLNITGYILHIEARRREHNQNVKPGESRQRASSASEDNERPLRPSPGRNLIHAHELLVGKPHAICGDVLPALARRKTRLVAINEPNLKTGRDGHTDVCDDKAINSPGPAWPESVPVTGKQTGPSGSQHRLVWHLAIIWPKNLGGKRSQPMNALDKAY